jgi:hypothetical protein
MLFKKKKSTNNSNNNTSSAPESTKVVSKFGKDSNPHSVVLYAVYPCPASGVALKDFLDSPTSNPTALYIAPSYKAALAATERLVYLNHAHHFLEWCRLRSIEPNLADSWINYTNDLLLDEEGKYAEQSDRFLIAKTVFDFSTIAGLVRSFYGISPLLIEPSCLIELKKIKEDTGSIPDTMETLTKVDPDTEEVLAMLDEISQEKINSKK